MEVELWWVWVAVGVIFIVGEIFTAGFFLLWFGVGALAAALCSFLKLNIIIQSAVFVGVSGILLAASRRFADRFTRKQPPGVGADRFIGQKGIVLEDIDNARNTGRVRVDEDEWRADSATDTVIPEGKTIEVVKVAGTHLVVKEIKEGS